MHEELKRRVDAEWAKVHEERSEAYRAKEKLILQDFSRRGLIQDAWHATLIAHLELARTLCEERAKIWADAITRSKGRFEADDAAFVERDVQVVMDAQREAAERAARGSGAGAHASTVILQAVGQWRPGTGGSISRDLMLRVEESITQAKEKARDREAHLAKSLPWWVQVILGPAPHHPFLLHVLAWTTYVFFTIGALYGLMQLIALVKKTWWP